MTEQFDPQQDWPPVGSVAVASGWIFKFEEGDTPGWWNDDRTRYARPFSPEGISLARQWATRLRPPSENRAEGETDTGGRSSLVAGESHAVSGGER